MSPVVVQEFVTLDGVVQDPVCRSMNTPHP
jgi:hypothetical protein